MKFTKPNITPGDWTKEKGWNDDTQLTVSASLTSKERGLIVSTDFTPFIEQKEANAQAIAALPALLQALEVAHDSLNEALNYLIGEPAQECAETLDTIKYALTKAGYTFTP